MAKTTASKRAKGGARKKKPAIEDKSEIVVRSGSYDGTHASSNFVVSGHSTGSPYTEMEALSHDVSRAAGVVPAYTDEDINGLQMNSGSKRRHRSHTAQQYSDDTSLMDVRSMRDGTRSEQNYDPAINSGADLDGPELYGPRPSLLAPRPLHPGRSYWKTGLWGALALASTAVVGLVVVQALRKSGRIRTW